MNYAETAAFALWTNDDDVVIAASADHATRLMQALCGCDGSAGDGHDDGQVWERIPEDRMVRVHGVPAPAGSWVGTNRPGWFGRNAVSGGTVETRPAREARLAMAV